MFADLGPVLFEDVLFGGLVGIALGTGVLLSLPYFRRRSVVTFVPIDRALPRLSSLDGAEG